MSYPLNKLAANSPNALNSDEMTWMVYLLVYIVFVGNLAIFLYAPIGGISFGFFGVLQLSHTRFRNK